MPIDNGSKLSSECNIAGTNAAAAAVNSAAVSNMAASQAAAAAAAAASAAATQAPTVPNDLARTSFPGLKYRNIGKTGLKVGNLGVLSRNKKGFTYKV